MPGRYDEQKEALLSELNEWYMKFVQYILEYIESVSILSFWGQREDKIFSRNRSQILPSA